MKRLCSLLLCVLMAFCLSGDCFAISFERLEEAGSAAVFDRLTEKIIFSHNGDKKMPVASTTKIMTSLLCFENENKDEAFKVKKESINTEGSSMGLRENDKVTLRTLAYGMMLSSGNDASKAAALRMKGTEEAFSRLMNERAEKAGMKNTNFTTSSGLDDGRNYSTACDMALLAHEALKNEDFRRAANTLTAKIDVGKRFLYLKNHNKLLFRKEFITGVKTGFTKKAGRCLVSSANLKGREFITVTLNLCDDFNIHEKIYEEIDSSLNLLEMSDLFKGGRAKVVGGKAKNVPLMLKDKGKTALFPRELKKLKTENLIYPFLYAPLNIGEEAGKFKVFLDEKSIFTLPLYTSSGVELKEGNVFKNVRFKFRH